MKKKIKDITLGEMNKECLKVKHCDKCKLKKACFELTDKNGFDKVKNKEVEL